MRFYVYAYYEPVDGCDEYQLPFYIGKGTGNRAWKHATNCFDPRSSMFNSHFYRKLRKLIENGVNPAIEILVDQLSGVEAIAAEKLFIAAIGRAHLDSGPLCNMTSGGDGIPGFRHSDDTRQRLSESAVCRWRDPVERERQSRIAVAAFNTDDIRRKRSQSATVSWQNPTVRRRRLIASQQLRKPVESVTDDGCVVGVYDSISDAAIDGYTISAVSECCAGKRKTHKGLRWRYAQCEI